MLGALKRHSRQLDAEMQAAAKKRAGATSLGNSRMAACMNAGGTFAECYYWIYVLGGGGR